MSSFSRNGQRGDVLLEALIGVLITAFVGAGMAHVASRIVNSQHATAVDALVVNELRNALQVGGVDLCADATPLASKNGLPSELKSSVTLARTCGAAVDQDLQIGGVTFKGRLPPKVELTATVEGASPLTVSSVVPASGGGGGP